MQEDWLKDIRNKMSDYEVDEPCDLWDNICRAKQQEQLLKPAGGSKVVALLWTKRVAAAAAMIALIFSAGYLTKDDKEKESLAVALSTTDDKGQSMNLYYGSDEKPLASAGSPRFRISARKQLADAVPIVHTLPEVMADTISVAEKTVPETKEYGYDETREAQPYRQQQYDKRKSPANTNNYIAHADIGKNISGRFSCEMFMTGGTSSVFNRKSTGCVSAVGIGPDNSNWEDSPLLGIILYNEGKEVETDIKYRLPIRAGISLAYKINERFSLGSGVTYTNLTSDIREGSDSHYFTGEQILHYVGIPLNVRYNIISWKGLDLYASSGLLIEKCVSGKLKKQYFLNNTEEKEETHNLNEKPFQWSVNASAGLQYNITHSIGLYAEPGVSYYFKDGTSLKTIYKNKPINFNLNLGLRFTFGNN